MNKHRWYLVLVLLLAACAPLQVGLEPGTATAVAAVTSTARAETTLAASPTGSPSATRTRPPTVVVSTVTPGPSATPSATATDTATATPEPPTPTRAATRRPATATSLPPTATSSATTPPVVTGPVELVSFTADRTEADPGEGVSLAWSARNTAGARLQMGVYTADGVLTWTTIVAELPANGTYVAAFENAVPGQIFRLEAYDAARVVGAALDVGVTRRNCPETYAFPFPADRFECAATPSTLAPMAEQVFERGRLVWLQTNNWINPRSQPIIFVMNNSGGWVSRADDFVAGEPESDPALVPPDGLYQPVGSLGKLWRNELRDSLGWALAPEVRYTGALQEGWTPQPGGVGGSWSGFTRDIYLRLSGSGVARMVWSSRFSGQTWELLP